MPRRLIPFFGLLTLLLTALAPPVALAQSPLPRVLLVGDSWAEFLWFNRSLSSVFAANGSPEITEKGDRTALGGTTAAEWAGPEGLGLLSDEIAANPSLEVIQITLGGNDILAGESDGGWFVGMGEVAQAALFARIASDIATVVDHVLAADPDLRVVLSAYDYPNFVDGSPLVCAGLWSDLGLPTPREINTASVGFDAVIAELAASRPRVTFVSHGGILQRDFGFPDRGIAPGQLQPPGDLTLPSPPEAMLGIPGLLDCIHLSPAGYHSIAQNLWDRFYRNFFSAGSPGGSPCVEDAFTLCLGGDRFRVSAIFQAGTGPSARARPIGLTEDTGLFTFRNPDNVELIVKVLDACAPPFRRYWVFAAGLTDQEVTLTVEDTQAGEIRTYTNPFGTPFAPVQDTDAFATCP